jgi:hypothetical protein
MAGTCCAEAGEEAGVCGQRERRHGCGLIEDDPFACEPLEMRARDVHEAVRGRPIGPRRVQGDHDDERPLRDPLVSAVPSMPRNVPFETRSTTVG